MTFISYTKDLPTNSLTRSHLCHTIFDMKRHGISDTFTSNMHTHRTQRESERFIALKNSNRNINYRFQSMIHIEIYTHAPCSYMLMHICNTWRSSCVLIYRCNGSNHDEINIYIKTHKSLRPIMIGQISCFIFWGIGCLFCFTSLSHNIVAQIQG